VGLFQRKPLVDGAGGSRLALSNMILQIPGDIAMFRALPEIDQQAVMQGATPAEQAKYRPYLKSNVSGQAAGQGIFEQSAASTPRLPGAGQPRRSYSQHRPSRGIRSRRPPP
jgi:hypothetical protein